MVENILIFSAVIVGAVFIGISFYRLFTCKSSCALQQVCLLNCKHKKI